MATLLFDSDPVPARRAVVAAFDMAGFSRFCNHPDHHAHIPRFISAVFEMLDSFTVSSLSYGWEEPSLDKPKMLAPDFIKYTGDGALLFWVSEDNDAFGEKFRTLLVATMRRFQQEFSCAAPQWEKKWCTNDIPKHLRVGIAMGYVFPLREPGFALMSGDIKDYAGYCINLAARLQSHCPEVGFLVQKCVAPNLPGLREFVALGMKGTSEEPVFIFDEDFQAVESREKYWRTKLRSID